MSGDFGGRDRARPRQGAMGRDGDGEGDGRASTAWPPANGEPWCGTTIRSQHICWNTAMITDEKGEHRAEP